MAQERTTTAYLTGAVHRDELPILLVIHEDDGDWQFLDGGSVEAQDAIAVHTRHVFEKHPDLHVLVDLPRGWAAERDSAAGDWRRFPWPSKQPASGAVISLNDLPEPDDAFDEKLISDVRTYGWHAIHVADENHPEHAAENAALGPHPIYDVGFSYTVGVYLTHGHPELVLVGRWSHHHAILSAAVEAIEGGQRFEVGGTADEVIEGYPVRFAAVTPTRREELLTYTSWLYGRRPFDALQLVLPDAAGRWPWDVAYDSLRQPLLDGSV